MSNPYKKPNEKVETRTIIGGVGKDDYDYLQRALPGRGLQDVVIGSLFKHLIIKLREANIPEHYDPANHIKIESILRRLTDS